MSVVYTMYDMWVRRKPGTWRRLVMSIYRNIFEGFVTTTALVKWLNWSHVIVFTSIDTFKTEVKTEEGNCGLENLLILSAQTTMIDEYLICHFALGRKQLKRGGVYNWWAWALFVYRVRFPITKEPTTITYSIRQFCICFVSCPHGSYHFQHKKSDQQGVLASQHLTS